MKHRKPKNAGHYNMGLTPGASSPSSMHGVGQTFNAKGLKSASNKNRDRGPVYNFGGKRKPTR